MEPRNDRQYVNPRDFIPAQPRLMASGNDRTVFLMMRSIFTHLQTIAERIVEINRLRIWLMPRDAIAERTPVSLDIGQVRDERLK
jgi:hypothetical protein